MSEGALRRWWRRLWASVGLSGSAAGTPADPAPRRAVTDDADEVGSAHPAVRRRYTAPSAADDPQREAHLGSVLQALAAGPLRRDELGRRVGAAAWGPGRLEAVVDHGIATRVLVETGDGAVRARYAD